MFSKAITDIALGSPEAEQMFTNIKETATESQCDRTFIATLRALLANRVSAENPCYLKTAYATNIEGKVEVSELYIADSTIHIFIVQSASKDANIRELSEVLTAPTYGFSALSDINAFLAPQVNASVLINTDRHSTVILLPVLTIQLFHLLQAITPRLLPWFFGDSPLTDDERELVRSLTSKTSSDYERLMDQFAQKVGFEARRITLMLDNFATDSLQTRLLSVQTRITSVQSTLDGLQSQYASHFAELTRHIEEEEDLRHRIDNKEHDNSLSDYFLHNTHLKVLSARNGVIEFIVKTTLDHFDVGAAERYIKQTGGYFYSTPSNQHTAFMSIENKTMLLHALFSRKPVLKLKLCGYYYLNVTGGVIDTRRGYVYGPEYDDYLPNPHLQSHACLGDYHQFIAKCLFDGNIIGAIAQCVPSAGSVNPGEAVSFQRIINALYASNAHNIIELPDGSSCTPSEAVKYLKEHKQEE